MFIDGLLRRLVSGTSMLRLQMLASALLHEMLHHPSSLAEYADGAGRYTTQSVVEFKVMHMDRLSVTPLIKCGRRAEAAGS